MPKDTDDDDDAKGGGGGGGGKEEDDGDGKMAEGKAGPVPGAIIQQVCEFYFDPEGDFEAEMQVRYCR